MITRVRNRTEIESVAQLARNIWRQHFVSIIGADQTEYMLEKFQSPASITSQIKSGVEYYIAEIGEQSLAYMAIVPDQSNDKMMISKIYVGQGVRGTGVGKQLLDLAENECKSRHIKRMWLTVNRYNHEPVAWYRRNGFKIIDEVKKDIGGGYYMDDFIMEKIIEEQSSS